MTTKTGIEWTRGEDGSPGMTWNPLLGCERVSPGCDACYAIRTATIRAGNPHPKVAAAFEGLTERRDGRLDWTGRINLLPDRLTEPVNIRKPQKIFVNSQSDLFHKDVPDEFIAQVFAVMALTPQHTYQLLTKRHARMRSLLSGPISDYSSLVWKVKDAMWELVGHSKAAAEAWRAMHNDTGWWPLRNLWLGVSVEDQKWADIRIPALLETPAAVRWLSCEPLLGALDLNRWLVDPTFNPAYRVARCGQQSGHWAHVMEHGPDEPRNCPGTGPVRSKPDRLDWIVCGGESGPGARPMHTEWARSLRDECVSAGVPFLFKQWGAWVAPSQMPEDTFMSWDVKWGSDMCDTDRDQWRFNKKDAGRLLDGREWNEFPRQPEQATA